MSSIPLLFMGSPEVAVTILESLLSAKQDVRAVITQPDKPAGRGQKLTPPPVKVFAESNQIPILQPIQPRDPSFIDQLKSYQPQVIIVAAYGRILPKEILELAPWGCLNVHFSLLPQYRGASCVASAILNGEKETGVTIMKIVEKLDAGAIFSQSKVQIDPNETTGELEERLAKLGAVLLNQTLDELRQNKTNLVEQNEALATFAPLLKKEDGKIQWEKTSQEIHNQIRAFNPWPIAYTFLDDKRVKIYGALDLSDKFDLSNGSDKTGTILQISKQGIEVACGKNAIFLTEIQFEGKKRMSAFEAARGERSLQIGKVFQ